VQGDSPPKRGIPQPIRGGPIKFGPYLLEARIAVGGTAEVYLARPVRTTSTEGGSSPPAPTRLVVKRLLPVFLNDPEGRTMFSREADLHAAVRHENVVDVYGSGNSDNGEPYLAMEYIDGVDVYRLLRRFRHEGRLPPPYVSVHIIVEILKALASVHAAKDDAGTPLGIIHRDVTPSNLYLSKEGRVKLGDFGIARSTSRATMRNAASAMLKGKIAYLAPEQVAGEPFDHRADLFSVASVLAEMLIGKALFPGAGQLAILLAIRDCRIDPLREYKSKLPPGLFEVLERALMRDPQARFQDASEFVTALASFDPTPEATRKELGIYVTRAQSSESSDAHRSIREGAEQFRAGQASGSAHPLSPPPPAPGTELPPRRTPPPLPAAATRRKRIDELPEDDSSLTTAQFAPLPSVVVLENGARHGPWSFARLVEALATGEIGRGDQIAYMGRPMKPVEEIEELVRFLPARTATTNQVTGPGAPDFLDDLATTTMLEILLKILERQESGVLFAEGLTTDVGEKSGAGRKELYFARGKLHHVASSNASELLGEYLVRRGRLERDELNLALAVLPKYGGRMGDTLIALGLVGPVDIFRAIREQGRDRVAALFRWSQGTVSFYRGQAAPHVEFPLDLDLPALILAGLEAQYPGDILLDTYRDKNEATLVRGAADRRGLVRGVKWPPVVTAIIATCAGPGLTLKEILHKTTGGGITSVGDVLRVIEILIAARLLAWK
jgi:eukaryotic-like serine/threonine-protein kinase